MSRYRVTFFTNSVDFRAANLPSSAGAARRLGAAMTDRIGGTVFVEKFDVGHDFDDLQAAADFIDLGREHLLATGVWAKCFVWEHEGDAWRLLDQLPSELVPSFERFEYAYQQRRGVAPWVVRIRFDKRRGARQVRRSLDELGVETRRRGKQILVGAATEQHARQLSERLRTQLGEVGVFEVGPARDGRQALLSSAIDGG